MKLLTIKKVAFASVFVTANLITMNAGAQNLLTTFTGNAVDPNGTTVFSGPNTGGGTFSSGTFTSTSAGLLQGYSNNFSMTNGHSYTFSFTPSSGAFVQTNTTGGAGPNTFVGTSIYNLSGSKVLSASNSQTFSFIASSGTYRLWINYQSLGTAFSLSNISLVDNTAPPPPPTPSGPSAADTQTSLQNTAVALHSTYALQNSVVANSLNYDCQVFDKNNICVSAGGRNTNVQAGGVNNVSALLIAAYRAMPEVRVGAYLDQNLSVTANNSPVNLGVNSPLFGLFAVWNENQDGTGTEVKVSGAYGQKNTTITRAVVGTSEAGTGSSTLSNSGVQAIAKYGFGLTRDAIVSPYVGIRYSQGNMGGYTEATSASVTTPLTYSALNTNATTFMAGVHGKYKLTPEATVQASVGLESDMNTNNGSLTASGITGLTPVNFNPNPVKTRPVAMLGAYYDVQKNQRVAVTGIYRQEPFQAVGSTTALATYTVGF